jgi:electron transfer flavoprotein beta subunit
MHIIVPIKQVPETSNVKMDPVTGTMVREGVETIVNPLDLYAIEVAIQLKEAYGGRVTVLSMGPLTAVKAVKEAIAMGCDDGVLISDRQFAGADTWSTAYVLEKAVRKLGEFDLVICGERATDGDTGQVGPNLAAALDVPLATYVSQVESLSLAQRSLVVRRMAENGYERLQMPLPSLLTVVKEISYPRLPTLRGKQRSRAMEIPVYSVQDLDVEKDKLGLAGSPTRVVRIVKAKDQKSLETAVDELILFLKNKELV